MRRRVTAAAALVGVALLGIAPLRAEMGRACTDCVDPRLLSLLPADVQYHRAVVADERNGFLLLRRATEVLVDSSSPVVSSDSALPDDATLRLMREWVAANEAALTQLDAALSAPDFQLPLFDPDTQWARCRKLVRLKLARATLRMAEGQWSDAASDLVGAFSLGQRVLDGDPVVLSYLVGGAFQDEALRGMRQLASLAAVPDAALAVPMRALQAAPNLCDAFARSLRVELTTFLLPAVIAAIPPDTEDARLVDILLNPSCTPQRPCRSTLRRMGRAHPRPFDAEDTTRIAGQAAETAIKRCGDPATRRTMVGNRDWFEAISGPIDPPLDAILAALLDGGRLTTSARQIDRAVAQFTALPNPLGRHNAYSAAVEYFPSSRQAERNATLTVLAIRRYEDRTGHLPASLDALIESGLLPALPIDPYGDGALRYDAASRAIWSVHEDDADNGAAAVEDRDLPRGKLRWTIPQVGQPR